MKFCPKLARSGNPPGIFATLLAAAAVGLGTAAAAAPAAPDTLVRLATTTSTENSGLLGRLLPEFERDSGYTVHVIAVGTGKALRMGRDGDVDLVLVHAREAEERFVSEGHGINRRDVMYNDFVIVGPPGDPAGIRYAATVTQALERIARNGRVFVSRGDDSGTHKKERRLWKQAGISPQGRWYREAGQGMGKVLQMAGELDAYTLTDRGTWLAMKDKLALALLFEGDDPLHNPYGIIAVNPKKHSHAESEGAAALIDWITSPKAQAMINDYRVNGERLFIPMAGNGGEFAAGGGTSR